MPLYSEKRKIALKWMNEWKNLVLIWRCDLFGMRQIHVCKCTGEHILLLAYMPHQMTNKSKPNQTKTARRFISLKSIFSGSFRITSKSQNSIWQIQLIWMFDNLHVIFFAVSIRRYCVGQTFVNAMAYKQVISLCANHILSWLKLIHFI